MERSSIRRDPWNLTTSRAVDAALQVACRNCVSGAILIELIRAAAVNSGAPFSRPKLGRNISNNIDEPATIDSNVRPFVRPTAAPERNIAQRHGPTMPQSLSPQSCFMPERVIQGQDGLGGGQARAVI